MGTLIGPFSNPHVESSGTLSHMIIATRLHTKLPPIASVPTYPASGVPMRLPMNMSRTKLARGSRVARMSRRAGVGMAAYGLSMVDG